MSLNYSIVVEIVQRSWGLPLAKILSHLLAVGVNRRRGLAVNNSFELSSTGAVACLSFPGLVASSS